MKGRGWEWIKFRKKKNSTVGPFYAEHLTFFHAALTPICCLLLSLLARLFFFLVHVDGHAFSCVKSLVIMPRVISSLYTESFAIKVRHSYSHFDAVV